MKMTVVNGTMIDLAYGSLGLLNEDTFETAIYISLLTDRRANPDDELPAGSGAGVVPSDRRGWAGDALADVANDRIGSRLWLLHRRKTTEETRLDAIFYAKEALEWMIDDGHATEVLVDAQWADQQHIAGRLDIAVSVTLINGDIVTYNIEYGII